MCGIAGFDIAPDIDIDASALVRLLVAGLAERGEDACGFAWREESGDVELVKAAMPPLRFLAEVPISLSAATRQVLVHVRDHTKGRPSVEGNNHPIRHGATCGVHNGIIQNDEELFTRLGATRALPGTSVDSEAIFLLLDRYPDALQAFPQLLGSYSTAWFDDRHPERMFLARGRGRPLVLGCAPGIALFASTRHALSFAMAAIEQHIDVREVPQATMHALAGGAVVDTASIDVQPFTESSTTVYSHEHPQAIQAREMAADLIRRGRPA